MCLRHSKLLPALASRRLLLGSRYDDGPCVDSAYTLLLSQEAQQLLEVQQQQLLCVGRR